MADDEDDDWSFDTGAVGADADGAEDEQSADDEQPAEADGEWRYSLSDLPDEDAEEADETEQSAVGGNVFGSLSSDTAVIEAGSPTLEGTLFVVAGSVLALLFFLQFYLLLG